MLKTLLAATTALTLISGAGFAETTYTHSKTETTDAGPSRDVDVSRTDRRSESHDGMVTEKNKTVEKRVDGDHDSLTLRFGRDHDNDMDHKDKTVTKSTSVSPNGDMTKSKSETTTVR